MMNRDFLRISDVAERARVSVDTVRYYERKGLLREVTREGGQRRFPPDVIRQIQIIRQASAIGFTLDELARIFERRASGRAPCGHVLDSAKRKLAELDQRIVELRSLRTTLAGIIESWEEKYGQTPPGSMAFLLETLIGKEEQSS